MITEHDSLFMREALKEAQKALRKGEIPVGAVVVHGGKVISRGHNKKESLNDPTAHAEVAAIRSAARKLGAWRLTGAALYVTLEPCVMCMGAIIQARIHRLVFAAFDPKAGACGSVFDLSADGRLNHRVVTASGVCEDEATGMLKGFFAALRAARLPKKTR